MPRPDENIRPFFDAGKPVCLIFGRERGKIYLY